MENIHLIASYNILVKPRSRLLCFPVFPLGFVRCAGMSPVLAIRQSDAEDLHHRIICKFFFSKETESKILTSLTRSITCVVSAAIGMTIAGCTTLLRLGLRIRRLWWDDALALGGLAFLLVTAIAGKLYYSLNGTRSRFLCLKKLKILSFFFRIEESETPQGSRVALYYIFSVTFDLTIWYVYSIHLKCW